MFESSISFGGLLMLPNEVSANDPFFMPKGAWVEIMPLSVFNLSKGDSFLLRLFCYGKLFLSVLFPLSSLNSMSG